MISRVAHASCSTPRSYIARYLKNWVSSAFYNYDVGIAELSQHRNFATLECRDVELLFGFDFC